ncbi:MAG: 2Fe-2S iron-sulfur cluster-binding protein, partial [Candidatus Bathyarchaeia archaeon]
MSQVTLTIDGRTVSMPPSATILDAASALNIHIPTLCRHPTLKPEGSCRLCVVEVEKSPGLVPSCTRTVEESMKVTTLNERILRTRRLIVELLLAEHPTPCSRNNNDGGGCELEAVAAVLGVSTPRFPKVKALLPVDRSNRGIVFDLNSCILCGRCVRACGDVQVQEVIAVSGKGSNAKVSFDFDDVMGSSQCTECGECVAYCPTGALFESLHPLPREPVRSVETVCPYCGVGCKVRYDLAGDTILRARGVRDSPVNRGMLCVKGKFGYDFTTDRARLTKPLIRLPRVAKEPLGGRNLSEVFREASWEEALDLVSNRLLAIRKQYGGDALYGFSSAKCTNEENYAFQKFMRVVLGTNNVDTCTRLCHSSSVYALDQALGSSAATNSL